MRIVMNNNITQLLEAACSGDKSAEASLFDLIYNDLRELARKHLRTNMPARLQTTSLVNESYLRLAAAESWKYRNRGHLFAVASRAMRQIVVDHARAALTQKRGEGKAAVTLDEFIANHESSQQPEMILALDGALAQLASANPRMAKLVELRFFGGFELSEIEPMLSVTARTLKRDWRVARAFLYDALMSKPSS